MIDGPSSSLFGAYSKAAAATSNGKINAALGNIFRMRIPQIGCSVPLRLSTVPTAPVAAVQIGWFSSTLNEPVLPGVPTTRQYAGYRRHSHAN
jgi:hypothetical protein